MSDYTNTPSSMRRRRCCVCCIQVALTAAAAAPAAPAAATPLAGGQCARGLWSSGWWNVGAPNGQCVPVPHIEPSDGATAHAQRAEQYQVVAGLHAASEGPAEGSDLLPPEGTGRATRNPRHGTEFDEGRVGKFYVGLSVPIPPLTHTTSRTEYEILNSSPTVHVLHQARTSRRRTRPASTRVNSHGYHHGSI